MKNFVLARLFPTKTTLTLQFISALCSRGNVSKLCFKGFHSTGNFLFYMQACCPTLQLQKPYIWPLFSKRKQKMRASQNFVIYYYFSWKLPIKPWFLPFKNSQYSSICWYSSIYINLLAFVGKKKICECKIDFIKFTY